MIKGCERGLLWNQACSDNLEMEQNSGTVEIPRKVLRKLNMFMNQGMGGGRRGSLQIEMPVNMSHSKPMC